MRPDEYHNPTKSYTRRGSRFELFFYEQIGAHYYLRFTRLALLLIICLTVIPMVAIFALFLTQSHADPENVNINLNVEPRAPNNVSHIIQRPPPPPPASPEVSRSPRGGEPARRASAAPGLNADAPPTPSPTPSPTPPRPPG